jgi:predicted nucleic acid-binding protein
VRALVSLAAAQGVPLLIPAPVIAEVWRGGDGRQARLAQFLHAGVEYGQVEIVTLDFQAAREIGVLLGKATLSVTDGAVCRMALLLEATVVTSDPDDIARLVPRSRIRTV